MASHMEDTTDIQEGHFPNDERTQRYGNLLFLLQSEPRHIAHLCRLVSMAEIDALLQTVMFTIYGNQYESREEHLLLTMFQVSLHRLARNMIVDSHMLVRPHISIRQYARILLPAPRKYARLAHDDHIHTERAWAELPQGSAS